MIWLQQLRLQGVLKQQLPWLLLLLLLAGMQCSVMGSLVSWEPKSPSNVAFYILHNVIDIADNPWVIPATYTTPYQPAWLLGMLCS